MPTMGSIRDYWTGDKPRCVLTVIHEPEYRQLPPEQMLGAAVESISAWRRDGANLPPAYFPDFGTITTAKPWGGRIGRASQGEIFIHPASDRLDEVLSITPTENPDVETAAEIFAQVRDRTGLEHLGFKSPDFQGVLNTAALVLKQDELMVAMYTEPDKVCRFLDAVCEQNIRFMTDLLDRAGRVDGNIWPYVWVPHDVGVCITEDLMPLLSPEQYRRFGIPYLERISDAFGGVFIHCCGRWGQHAESLADSGVNILGAEFHYPFTKVEEIRPSLPDIVLAPYLADFRTRDYPDFATYAADLLDRVDESGPLWVAISDAPDWQAQRMQQVLEARGCAVEGFCE
jgi:hypothetical protein